MNKKLKNRIKSILHQLVDDFIFARARRDAKFSPRMKVAQRHLFNYYQDEIRRGRRWDLRDTGFRNYSQFEEDGILLYIFAAIGTTNRQFVDIGAGHGVNSNCANLVANFGWHGLFIDGSERNVEAGREYYRKHPDTWLFPPKFACAFVQRENINQIIQSQGFDGEIDLVSIDIDGNDYWVWDALSIIEPRVVIIETHVEFGEKSIVVPYDKEYCYPGKHPDYHGASPVAMVKLAEKKGYRLVGSNQYGFNTIYVKKGVGEDVLLEVGVDTILSHPRNRERMERFKEIADWEYLEV